MGTATFLLWYKINHGHVHAILEGVGVGGEEVPSTNTTG